MTATQRPDELQRQIEAIERRLDELERKTTMSLRQNVKTAAQAVPFEIYVDKTTGKASFKDEAGVAHALY